MAFNITATIQLQAPGNINQVASQIQSQLQNINAKINIQIPSGVQASLNQLATGVQALNVNLSKLTQTVNTSVGSMAKLQNSLNQTATTMDSVKTSSAQTSTAITGASGAMEEFGRVAGIAGRRFLGFTLIASTVSSVFQGISTSVKAALDFDRQFIKLSQVGEAYRSDLVNLNKEISNLSKNFGVSSSELLNSAVTLRQAGLSIGDVTKAMEALAKASLSPSFDNMAQTTEGLIAIMAQFRIQTSGVEAALSSINAVANAYAVESKDILQAVQRTGGAFRSIGGDLNEFIALFTSVRSTTRESAESIATGLRTIFSRLQRPELVDNLKELGVNLRYTREEASALGNNSLEKQFVGGYEAVRRLSEALRNIPTTDPRYAQIVEDLGGYRQISKVIPLLQEFTTTQNALNIAQNAGSGITSTAAQAQGNFLVRISKLKEEFLGLTRTIVNSPGFEVFTNNLIKLGNVFTTLLDKISPLIPLMLAFASIKLFAGAKQVFSGVFEGFKGKGPKTYATGGPVPGHGSFDTAEGLLTPGEHVLTRRQVSNLGGHEQVRRLADGSKKPEEALFDFGYLKSSDEKGFTSKQLEFLKFATSVKGQLALRNRKRGDFNPEFLYKNEKEKADYINQETILIKQDRAIDKSLPKLFPSQYDKTKSYKDIEQIYLEIGIEGSGITNLGKENRKVGEFKKDRSGFGAVKEGSLKLPLPGHSIDVISAVTDGETKRGPLGAGYQISSSGISSSRLGLTKDQITDLKGIGVKDVSAGVNVRLLSSKSSNEFEQYFKSKFTGDEYNLLESGGKSALNSVKGILLEKIYLKNKHLDISKDNAILDFTKIPESLEKELYGKTNKNKKIFGDVKYASNNDAIADAVGKYIKSVLPDILSGQLPAKFARGGVVPGQGNYDSVPADLTPGEFVIKKDSAQKIGYDTLHQMNEGRVGYARGGFAQNPDDEDSDKIYKLLGMKRPGQQTEVQKPGSSIYTSPINLKEVIRAKGDIVKAFGFNPYKNGVISGGIQLGQFAPEESNAGKASEFRGVFYPDTRAIKLNNKIRKNGDLPYKNYEELIQVLSHETSHGIDVASGASNNIKGEGYRGIIPSSYIQGSPAAALAAQFTQFQKAKEQSTGVRLPPYKHKPEESFADALAHYTKDKVFGGGEKNKAFHKYIEENILNKFQKRATGGSIEDTIPALLTPGEFVINRESASKIGTHELQNMNRNGQVRGYNRGGQVGSGRVMLAGGSKNPLGNGLEDDRVKKAYEKIVKLLGFDPQQLGIVNEINVGKYGPIKNSNAGSNRKFKGAFFPEEKNISINDRGQSQEDIYKVLAHEIGHAIDLNLGGGKKYSSKKVGSEANTIGLDRLASNIKAGQAGYKTADVREGFADSIKDAILQKGQGVSTDSSADVFALLQNNYGKSYGPNKPVNPIMPAKNLPVDDGGLSKRLEEDKKRREKIEFERASALNPPIPLPGPRPVPLPGPAQAPLSRKPQSYDKPDYMWERASRKAEYDENLRKDAERLTKAGKPLVDDGFTQVKQYTPLQQGVDFVKNTYQKGKDYYQKGSDYLSQVWGLGSDKNGGNNNNNNNGPKGPKRPPDDPNNPNDPNNPKGSSGLRGALTLLGLTIAGTVSEAISKGAGEAKNAVGNGEFGFTAAKVLSSSITGATLGGSVGSGIGDVLKDKNAKGSFLHSLGSAAGPLGVLAGAALAAVNAFHEAESELQAAKIELAQRNLSDIYGVIGHRGTGVVNQDEKVKINENINNSLEAIRAKADSDNRSFFGLFRDSKGSSKQVQEQTRIFGQSQSENAGRTLSAYITTQARELGANAGSVEDIRGQIRGQFSANLDRDQGEQLRLLQLANPTESRETIKAREVEKALKVALGERARIAGNQALTQRDRGQVQFDRLADILERVNVEMGQFRSSLEGIGGLFEGRVSSTKINLQDKSSVLFGLGSQAENRTTIAGVGSGLGSAGPAFVQMANAQDDILRELPGLIFSQFNGNQAPTNFNETDFAEQIRNAQEQSLGGRGNLNTSQISLLGTIQSNLQKLDFDGVKRLVDSNNQSGLVSALTQGSTFTQNYEKITKIFENSVNEFAAGVAEYQKRELQIDQSVNNVNRSSSSLEAFDLRRGFLASGIEPSGTQGQLSVDRANAPLRQRAEYLANLIGVNQGDAQNPEIIGRRQRELQAQVIATRQQRDDSAARGPNSRETRGLTENLSLLEANSARAGQALNDLANSSERNQAAQERLTSLNKGRQERTSYALQLLTASPEERSNISRGQRDFLSLTSNNANNISDGNPEQVRNLISVLSRMNGVSIANLGGQNLAPRLARRYGISEQDAAQLDGPALLNREAGRDPRFSNLIATPDQRNEVETLLAGMRENIATEQTARQQILDTQRGLQTVFFDRLNASMDRMFARMAVLQAEDAERTGRGRVSTTQANLNAASDEFDFAGRAATVGIRNQQQVQFLNDNRSRERLVDANQVLSNEGISPSNLIDRTLARVNHTPLSFFNASSSAPYSLSNRGVDEQLQNFRTNSFGNINTEELGRLETLLRGTTFRGGSTPQQIGQIIRNTILPEYTKIVERQRREAGLTLQSAQLTRQQLPDAVGFVSDQENQRQLRNFTPQNTIEGTEARLQLAITAHQEASTALQGFTTALTDARNALSPVNAGVTPATITAAQPAVENLLQQGVNVLPPWLRELTGLNSGGPIQGLGNTDTVPAILTPGEFVMSAPAVKAIGVSNLMKMNAQKFNDGGLFTGESIEQRQRREENEERIRQSQEVETPEYIARRNGRRVEAANYSLSQTNTSSVFSREPVQELPGDSTLLEIRRLQAARLAQNPAQITANQERVNRDADIQRRVDNIGRPRGLPSNLPINPAFLPLGQGVSATSPSLQTQADERRLLSGRNSSTPQESLPGDNNLTRRGLNDLIYGSAPTQQPILYGPSLTPQQTSETRLSLGNDGIFQPFAISPLVRQPRLISVPQDNRSAIERIREYQRLESLQRRPFGETQERDRERRYDRQYGSGSFNRNALLRRNSGGPVPGYGSSDTVPALLTPGEFVLNKAATSAIGLSQLHSMNGIKGYNTGGLVSNNNNVGGSVDIGNLSLLQESLTGFITGLDPFISAMKSFPHHLTGSFKHDINLNINGAEAMSSLMPEIEKMIESQANEVLSNYISQRLYEAGPV